jgi:prophage DNA circulation protein
MSHDGDSMKRRSNTKRPKLSLNARLRAQGKGTLFHPHYGLLIAALRCIAESPEVLSSRILSSRIYPLS